MPYRVSNRMLLYSDHFSVVCTFNNTNTDCPYQVRRKLTHHKYSINAKVNTKKRNKSEPNLQVLQSLITSCPINGTHHEVLIPKASLGSKIYFIYVLPFEMQLSKG